MTDLLEAYQHITHTFSVDPGTLGPQHLPPNAISELVRYAVAKESIFDATAAMDVLFDAFESFPRIVDEFELIFQKGNKSTRKRILCCLGYLTKKGINRRDPIRKHYTEVREDAEHFQSFVQRAAELALGLDKEQ